MKKLMPSLLAADYENLMEQLKIVEEAGAEGVHIDVMDGSFVPNFAFGIPIIQYMRPRTKCLLDVHLMMQEPERFINKVKQAGADIITVHVEAVDDTAAILQKIKNYGICSGVALSPGTAETILTDKILKLADIIHIMSVQPGLEKQTFIEQTLSKIRNIREWLDVKGYKAEIEVDGDVNLDNVDRVLDAGADIIVCGTAMFNGDLKSNIKQFQEKLSR